MTALYCLFVLNKRNTIYCTAQTGSLNATNVNLVFKGLANAIDQCFPTAGPRVGARPWHQLYRAARGCPGICHFSFLSIFHEYTFHSENILRRIIFVNVSKSSDSERLNNICVANVSDQDLISPVIHN